MSEKSILIVEDDIELREAIGETIELAGYDTVLAQDGMEALRILETNKPNLIITDVQMDKMNGHQLLAHVQKNYPDIPVMLMTAYGNINDAVQTLQLGAVDYLAKPFEPKVLIEKIKRYVPIQFSGNQPIAEAQESKDLLNLALKVSDSDATVLISGESGTGKEVLARYIHDHSSRHNKPFVAINCAAIPENMLEATLFGYEKGAFTGAYKAMPGKFEQAEGGTLLLDEISEMDLGLQAKLLRVIQEREVERIGGSKLIPLDVRIIATTNRDMQTQVNENQFREDLYYRLNVFPLHWVPLRSRKDDILPMANYLLQKHYRGEAKGIPEFSDEAKRVLQIYHWPGNAREMDNVVQRALILQQGSIIEVQDLHLPAQVASAKDTLIQDVESHEHNLILETLKSLNGNRKEAAEKLGISERTLRYKLAKIRKKGIEV